MTSIIVLLLLADFLNVAQAAFQNFSRLSNHFVSDLFKPLANDNPRNWLPTTNHPVTRQFLEAKGPGHTNKFYTNLLLDKQNTPIYLYPYAGFWDRKAEHSGFCFSHSDQKSWTYSDTDHLYYLAPTGICQIAIGATELDESAKLSLNEADALSAKAQISANDAKIEYPFVQGQAFITAKFRASTPVIYTSSASIIKFEKVSGSRLSKYKISLNDDSTWIIYASRKNYTDLSLTQTNSQTIISNSKFDGYIQLAKLENNSAKAEAVYDDSAGTYPVHVSISASRVNEKLRYNLKYSTEGLDPVKLLHFALPHHQATLVNKYATAVRLPFISKGMLTAVQGSGWTLEENEIPDDIEFLSNKFDASALSKDELDAIQTAVSEEVKEDFTTNSDVSSYYFSGKKLAKYAYVCLVASKVDMNSSVLQSCVDQLEDAMKVFVNNDNQTPLMYDFTWKGIVTNDGLAGDPNRNFGNSYYNDHHFHYGYFIQAAAILGHLKSSWLTPKNRRFVETLIRDTSNPNTNDPYFPFMRSFDWYQGHSWAKGLFATSDGKDQESSSEDVNHSYALKLWGLATGDDTMTQRANLMLSLQKRVLNSYFLYPSQSEVMPPYIRKAFVSGILFENKIDHTTYFSSDVDKILGIHMIPTTPISPFIRQAGFVRHEWNDKLSNLNESLSDGFKGIVNIDYAIADGNKAFSFFSSSNFDRKWLDDGASLSWYLFFSAMMRHM